MKWWKYVYDLEFIKHTFDFAKFGCPPEFLLHDFGLYYKLQIDLTIDF